MAQDGFFDPPYGLNSQEAGTWQPDNLHTCRQRITRSKVTDQPVGTCETFWRTSVAHVGHVAEALDLEEEVMEHLRENGECDMGALRQVGPWARVAHALYMIIWDQACNPGLWMLKLHMLEGLWKVAPVLLEGARTNYFGLGCPLYCVQPSLPFVVLVFLTGLCFGLVLAAILLWTLWTTFGFSISWPAASASPAHSRSRYSVLAEYLHDPRNQRSRSRWFGLYCWGT